MKGVCVNEFTGLTFNCEGEDPRGCLTTGEQVLKRLGFEKTLSQSLANQGMVALGTYLATYFFLATKKPKFMKVVDPEEVEESTTRGGAIGIEEGGRRKKKRRRLSGRGHSQKSIIPSIPSMVQLPKKI